MHSYIPVNAGLGRPRYHGFSAEGRWGDWEMDMVPTLASRGLALQARGVQDRSMHQNIYLTKAQSKVLSVSAVQRQGGREQGVCLSWKLQYTS